METTALIHQTFSLRRIFTSLIIGKLEEEAVDHGKNKLIIV
jgi:hypothetical protein